MLSILTPLNVLLCLCTYRLNSLIVSFFSSAAAKPVIEAGRIAPARNAQQVILRQNTHNSFARPSVAARFPRMQDKIGSGCRRVEISVIAFGDGDDTDRISDDLLSSPAVRL